MNTPRVHINAINKKPIQSDQNIVVQFKQQYQRGFLFSILIRFHPVFLSFFCVSLHSLLINRSTKKDLFGDFLDSKFHRPSSASHRPYKFLKHSQAIINVFSLFFGIKKNRKNVTFLLFMITISHLNALNKRNHNYMFCSFYLKFFLISISTVAYK